MVGLVVIGVSIDPGSSRSFPLSSLALLSVAGAFSFACLVEVPLPVFALVVPTTAAAGLPLCRPAAAVPVSASSHLGVFVGGGCVPCQVAGPIVDVVVVDVAAVHSCWSRTEPCLKNEVVDVAELAYADADS